MAGLQHWLVETKDISFNTGKNVFYTDQQTLITDNFKNKFSVSNLEFNTGEKIFKGNQIQLSDNKNNTLELNNGFVDLKSNELVGSDFIYVFNKNFFGNVENDPRFIGRYIITDKSKTHMKKSSFTTCKKIDGKCFL